jgi:hypothetical protein
VRTEDYKKSKCWMSRNIVHVAIERVKRESSIFWLEDGRSKVYRHSSHPGEHALCDNELEVERKGTCRDVESCQSTVLRYNSDDGPSDSWVIDM